MTFREGRTVTWYFLRGSIGWESDVSYSVLYMLKWKLGALTCFLFRFLACILLLERAVISSACAVAVCLTSGESDGVTTVNKRILPLPLTGLAGAASLSAFWSLGGCTLTWTTPGLFLSCSTWLRIARARGTARLRSETGSDISLCVAGKVI